MKKSNKRKSTKPDGVVSETPVVKGPSLNDISKAIVAIAERVKKFEQTVTRSTLAVHSNPAPAKVERPKRNLSPEYLAALHKNRAAYHDYVKNGGERIPSRRRDQHGRFINDEAFLRARNAYRAYLASLGQEPQDKQVDDLDDALAALK